MWTNIDAMPRKLGQKFFFKYFLVTNFAKWHKKTALDY